MAYIGVQPTAGQYRKLDNISASFNGSTTSFTTSVGGTNVTAGTAQQLIVSLGGVIQQPDTDYTVSTNTITFTTAPTSGLDFFAILMGDALNTVTPSDGSVTTSKLAGSLSVGLTAGSASTPALFFTGDTNNGIFSPSTDAIAVTTAGSERLRVTSAGLVGIGTSSPTQALTVATASSHCYIESKRATQATGQVAFALRGGTGGTDWILYQDSGSDNLQVYGNGANRLAVTSAGNVGIGTTTPAPGGQGLHVHNASAADSSVRVTNSTTGATDVDGFAIQVASDGTAKLRQFESSSITFETAATERGRWDSSGRLLVGTSTASSQAVAGSVSATQLILGGDASKRYAGTVGTVTATTGTTVFTFQNTVVNARAAFVKVKIATRSTSNTASNSPCAQYAFQLHKTSLSVCTLNGATTMFEYTYSRATHFAFADSGSGVCTVTLTNPTGQSLTGNYEVEIVDGSIGWALTSVTVT